MTVTGYPCVNHVDQDARPTIALDSISDDPAIIAGEYKRFGYSFHLAPYLKRFVFLQYGQWRAGYARNKTHLRKLIYGRVDEVYEIPNPYKNNG